MMATHDVLFYVCTTGVACFVAHCFTLLVGFILWIEFGVMT